MKIGKYEFDSKEQAESKEEGLGTITNDETNETYPSHNHTVIHLGHIALEKAEYDEEGNVVKEPVLSSKWHVDVLWNVTDTLDENDTLIYADHPYGWKSYSVDLDNEGVHRFYGLNYVDFKFNSDA